MLAASDTADTALARMQEFAQTLAWTPSDYLVVLQDVSSYSVKVLHDVRTVVVSWPYFESIGGYVRLPVKAVPSSVRDTLAALRIDASLGTVADVRDLVNEAITSLQLRTYVPPPEVPQPRNKLLIGVLAVGAIGILGGLAVAAWRGVYHD